MTKRNLLVPNLLGTMYIYGMFKDSRKWALNTNPQTTTILRKSLKIKVITLTLLSWKSIFVENIFSYVVKVFFFWKTCNSRLKRNNNKNKKQFWHIWEMPLKTFFFLILKILWKIFFENFFLFTSLVLFFFFKCFSPFFKKQIKKKKQ